MAGRDRVAEIIDIKRRGQRQATRLHGELELLERKWNRLQKASTEAADFFPIRAVTLLEVFCRAWIAQLIDRGAPYAEHAVKLVKDFKIDYGLVRAVEGRKVSLGDFVAHGVSLNSFSQICACFTTLIGADLLSEVAKATAWKDGPSSNLLIADIKWVSCTLVRLYEVRHVLCHEYPESEVYQDKEIAGFLKAAGDFAGATDAVLTKLAFGTVPIPPAAEMVKTATTELEESEQLLAEVSARIEGNVDLRGLKLFRKSQVEWIKFRRAAAEMRGDNARGGSLSRYLRLLEAIVLTEARIDQLKPYLDRGEGDF